jgi:dolichyl-phosphate beta-glucosyltransferase
VNDGSTDNTLDVLQAMVREQPERIRVLDQRENRGKGESVRRGLLAALETSPDLVGFWDADLATPLELLPGFLDVLRERPGVEMVFGARVKLLGRAIERHTWRHYFGRVFATVVSTMLELPIYDTQCGAKIFRSTAGLGNVLRDPFVSPWLFDVEILARFRKEAARDSRALADMIYELPLAAWHDVAGSKLVGFTYVRAAASLAIRPASPRADPRPRRAGRAPSRR